MSPDVRFRLTLAMARLRTPGWMRRHQVTLSETLRTWRGSYL